MFAQITRFSIITLALACLGSAAAPALAQDRLILDRTEKDDGSSIVQIGLRLPSDWNPKFGMDVGAAAARRSGTDPVLETWTLNDALPLSAPWATDRRPSSAAWGNITMPNSLRFLGFDDALLNMRVEPENENARFGAVISRNWTLGDALKATMRNEYTLTHRGLGLDDTDSSDVLRQNPSFRVSVPFTRTSLVARSQWTSLDPVWHGSLSAEQKLFGGLKVTGSVLNVQSDVPAYSVSAEQKLSGGVTVTGSVLNLQEDTPAYSLRAGWTHRW